MAENTKHIRWAAVTVLAACLITSAAGAAFAEEAGPTAKNVIVMISDGCGYFQVDAASVYRNGEPGRFHFEAFPIKLGMSTYPAGGSYEGEKVWSNFGAVKRGATDSAAAATAMASGRKTYGGAIGVVGSEEAPEPVRNVVEAAEALGKATGVVTTVQFSHATPAGFVAHNASRDNYEEIAHEMLYDSAVDVIMGCGHPWFDRNGKLLGEPDDEQFVGGLEVWEELKTGKVGADADGDGAADPWTVIHSREDFKALAGGETPKRVLGIPRVQNTLQQNRGGDAFAAPYEVARAETVPTLGEMVEGALNVLDDDPDGFFLMVEGGAIDWACHSNRSGRLIEEELDFAEAVEAVITWVHENSSWDETLLIVTGDHETGYLTGPGSGPDPKKKDYTREALGIVPEEGKAPVWNTIACNGTGNLPGMEWHSGSHTNSLIPLYAKGAGAKRLAELATKTDPVRGTYMDNTDIAKVVFEVMK